MNRRPCDDGLVDEGKRAQPHGEPGHDTAGPGHHSRCGDLVDRNHGVGGDIAGCGEILGERGA